MRDLIKRILKKSFTKEKNSSIKNWELHHKINRTGEQFETELKYRRRK